jgi:hypothetical protein
VRHTTNSYCLGTQIRLSAAVKDLTGAAVDATTTTISVKPRGGTATPLTTNHDGTGAYHADFEPTAGGITYAVRVVTLNPDSAAEGQFYVLPSQFP